MGTIYFKTIAEISDEPMEVYWLAGLQQSDRDAWFVVVALLARDSQKFHRMRLPIGVLPLLTLGSVFKRGELCAEPCRGTLGQARIADVSKGRVVTSSQIDSALYSFGSRPSGTQRLLEYETPSGRVLVPMIEMVRYLFLHNKTLANYLMRPGAINLLFVPQRPGAQVHRHIRFTDEMPHRCLSHEFVKEFAWLALDPEARKSWDSVAKLSAGKDYVDFAPPSLRDSEWEFRGVEHNGSWLVLELLGVRGRAVPCTTIEYSHPSIKKTVKLEIDVVGPPRGSSGKGKGGSKGNGKETKYALDGGESGSSSSRPPSAVDVKARASDFSNAIEVRKLPEGKREVRTKKRPPGEKPGPPIPVEPRTVNATAGERTGPSGGLPPIEFKLLEPVGTCEFGTLDALRETVAYMQQLVPCAQISLALCFVKDGRAFSRIGRHRRMALVVAIIQPRLAPIVLLDVERTGVPALSLMSLRFKLPDTDAAQIESAAKLMLDGLVDGGGLWSHEAESALGAVCACERHPKVLFPRHKNLTAQWATKLVERLGLQ
jgi:hypothetical protein